MFVSHRSDCEVQFLTREAARCERLCAGSYDPGLTAQLLALAREYRGRAAAAAMRLERGC